MPLVNGNNALQKQCDRAVSTAIMGSRGRAGIEHAVADHRQAPRKIVRRISIMTKDYYV